MTAPEVPLSAPKPVGTVLPAPEHPEVPAEALQAFIEVDRKCGVFIFPQLRQLGAGRAVEDLIAAATLLAASAAAGPGPELVAGYRDLLGRAQAALRVARSAEVEQESEQRSQRQSEAKLAAALLSAKSRLPASRMARLQQRLSEMADEEGGDRVGAVEDAVTEWERLSQVRQSREAERLADRAHGVVRPRQQETARSRKALRDQAKVVELARAFVIGEQETGLTAEPETSDQ